MHLNLDAHHQYALDRQQRLLADAAAHGLADRMPTRSRIARFLQRAADRPDAATPPCGQVGAPLVERS